MYVVCHGVESATHRDTLKSILDDFPLSVDVRAGISFKTLRARRLGPRYITGVAKLWPIVLDAGVSMRTSLEADEAVKFAEEYYTFLRDTEEVTTAIEFEHQSLSGEQAEYLSVNRADPRVVPVWSQDDQLNVLQDLLNTYDRVGLSASMLKDRRVPAILRASRSITSNVMVLGTGMFDLASRSGATGVSGSAWLSAAKFGEFIYFDGRAMVKATSAEREFLLKKHKDELQALGFNVDLLAREDAREYTRLAGYSYLKWAESLGSTPEHSTEEEGVAPSTEIAPVEHTTAGGIKVTRVPTTLPGFATGGVEAPESVADGSGVELRVRTLLTTVDAPLRVCDSCFLKTSCPAFVPASSCAFNLPMEIRTDAQRNAVLDTMFEIQATRVAFARFGEEVTGGELDPKVGAEMDRMFRMAEKMKQVKERRERVSISVEHQESEGSTGVAGGVMSRIFGKQTAVPEMEPIDADIIISEIEGS